MKTYRLADRQLDRKIGRQTDRQRDRQAGRQTYRQADRQPNEMKLSQTGRQMKTYRRGRPIDGQIDRQSWPPVKVNNGNIINLKENSQSINQSMPLVQMRRE